MSPASRSRDPDGVVLVDASVTGQHEAIIGALADRMGVPKDSLPLRQVLLTHAHADHYGSARELARRTGAALLGPADEADTFAGRRPLPAPRVLERERPLFERITPDLVPPPPPVVLDREVQPGDALDWEIGAELVAAPGHTPGQLVVWIPTHRTLIAADALATHDGRPVVGVFNVDPEQAARTATKLLEQLQPYRLCVAHGAPLTGDVRGQFDVAQEVRFR